MRYALPLLASILFASPALADPVEAEVDLLELHVGDGDEHFTFDSALSVGSDTDRFEVRASGGSDVGPLIDNVQLEALYVRNVSDKLTLLAGIRQDVRGGEDLTHGSFAFVVTPVDWLEIEQENSGHGVTDIQAALRVRKTLTPLLEVYGGAIHERLVGKTLDIARAGGTRGRITRGIVGMALRF